MEIDLDNIKKKKCLSELLEFSILNIDKPSGPTSFKVAEIVRKKLNQKKSSHFGTLDPKVSGVLPIALNRACRLTGYFMKKDKEYIGIMRLHKEIEDDILQKEKQKFIGKIMQKPPVKSRVKRVEREREVKKFEVFERDGMDVLFLAEVEAGTYIRKLIDDLGKNIGGAHMLELRRIRAGIFEEKESYTLYQLDEALMAWKHGDESLLKRMLIPGEIIIRIMPVVFIMNEALPRLLRGSPIFVKDLAERKELAGGITAVFCGERLIEIAKIVDDGKIFAKPEFVLN